MFKKIIFLIVFLGIYLVFGSGNVSAQWCSVGGTHELGYYGTACEQNPITLRYPCTQTERCEANCVWNDAIGACETWCWNYYHDCSTTTGCSGYEWEHWTESGCSIVYPTNTPRPTNTPGGPSPTATPTNYIPPPPSSCPPGTQCTCQAQSASCSFTKLFVGGCSNPSDWCCCTPGCNPCDSAAYALIYVYEDTHNYGVWDNDEPTIPLNSGDSRVEGATLSWNYPSTCSSGTGVNVPQSGNTSNDKRFASGSTTAGACCTDTGFGDGCCGEDLVEVPSGSIPIHIDYNISQIPVGFDQSKVIQSGWGGVTDCVNHQRFVNGPYWLITLRNGCDFNGVASFTLNMPSGSQYTTSGSSSSYLTDVSPGCMGDHSLLGIGLRCSSSGCGVLSHSQSGFECGNSFSGWRADGTATQSIERSTEQHHSGNYSLKIGYSGVSTYYTAYTRLTSAPADGEGVGFSGYYRIASKTGNPILSVTVQHWNGGTYIGEDSVILPTSQTNAWLPFEIFSPRMGVSETSITLQFVTSGDTADDRLVWYADDLCANYEAPVLSPPTFGVLSVSDVSTTPRYVTAVSTGLGGDLANHICEDEFRTSTYPRRVKFWVRVNDADGYNDISTISLRFRNSSASDTMTLIATNLDSTSSYSTSILPSSARIISMGEYSSGISETAIFTVEFDNNFPVDIYDLDVSASDGVNTLAWTDATRDFKVWDCQVPVSGTVYDTSGVTTVCPNYSSLGLVAADYFASLRFNNVSVSPNIVFPNFRTPVGVGLTWGVTYVPTWTELQGSTPGGLKLTGEGQTGGAYCGNSSFIINDTVSGFNPYVTNIGATVEYTSVANQDPWWQGRGVSILGRTGVTSQVPATCRLTDGCTPALNIDNTGRNDNGVVVSSSLGLSAGEWGYDSNWYRGGHTQTYLPNLTYSQMHSELFDSKGVGREESDWAGVVGDGGTGLVFVTGPLTITSNHIVAPGGFLMVVVNGSITINENVTQLDGAYMASGGQILIGGENDIVLTINGMIYATGNIDITRGFVTHVSNNLNPAVVVDMRPDLIFNAPSYMFDNRTRL